MKTIKYLLTLFLVMLWTLLSAQHSFTVDGVSFAVTPTAFSSCNTAPFTVTLANTSGVSKSAVAFVLHSANAQANPDNVPLSITPAGTNYTFDPLTSKVLLSDPLPAGETVVITVPVRVKCSLLALPVVPANVTVGLTGEVGALLNNLNFQVPLTSANLSFTSFSINGVTQSNYVYSGHVNDTPVRRFFYTNTSTTHDFNGALYFQDVKGAGAQITSFTVEAHRQDGTLLSSVASIQGSAYSGTNINANILINNLPPAGYVVVVENIKIVSCPESNAAGSVITMKWGCPNDYCLEFDQEINGSTVVNADIVRGNERPELVWEFIDNPAIDNCIDDRDGIRTYTMRLVNYQDAPAFNGKVGMRGLGYRSQGSFLAFIKSGDIRIISGQNVATLTTQLGKYNDLPTKFRNESNQCFTPGEQFVDAWELTFTQFNPDDVVIIQWTERDCCPLTKSPSNSFSMSGWAPYNNNTYTDECGRTYGTSWAPGQSLRANDEKWIQGATQNKIPTVTNMFGCQSGRNNPCGVATTCSVSDINNENAPNCDFTEGFIVENDGFYIRQYYGGFPIDLTAPTDQTRTFRIDVDLTTEGKLILAPRQHFTSGSTNRGHVRIIVNGVTYEAASVTLVPATDAYYQANVPASYLAPEMYRATFFLPEALWNTTDPGFRESRISSFINASEIHFDLSAICDGRPSPQGGASKYLEQMYFVPQGSGSCPGQCRVQIGSYEGKVNVMCPGCEWPGIVTNTFDFRRTTFGLADANDNGFPDAGAVAGVFHPAMQDRYGTFRDDVRAFSRSSFWGSQGVLDELEALHGENYLNTFCRVDQIPYGADLTVVSNSIHLRIIRGGTVIFDGILPNSVATYGTNKFLFQVPASLIGSSFNYQLDDVMELEVHYQLGDFNFPKDVYQETVDINVLAYMTGVQKDVNGGTTQNNPLGPDINDIKYGTGWPTPHHVYYCEGWGTTFRFIKALSDYNQNIYDFPWLMQNTDGNDRCAKTFYGRITHKPGGKLNAFPNEVRTNTGNINYVDLEIPNGYVVDPARSYLNASISYRSSDLPDFTQTWATQRIQPTFNIEDRGPVYDAANRENGRKVRVTYNYNTAFLPDNTTNPPSSWQPNGTTFFIGDEGKETEVYLALVQSCAGTLKPSEVSLFTDMPFATVQASYTYLPIVTGVTNLVQYPFVNINNLPDGSSINVKWYYASRGGLSYYTQATGGLIISPSTNTAFIGERNACMEFTIRNETAGQANNVFVAPQIQSGDYTISSMEYQMGSTGPWVPMVLRNGLYWGAGNGIFLAASGGNVKIRMCGNFTDCGTNQVSSSVKMNYGWNCDTDHPTSIADLSNACNVQFAIYDFVPRKVLMTSQAALVQEVNCSDLSVNYTVTSQELGGIYDPTVRIKLPAGTSVDPLTVVFELRDKFGTLISTLTGLTPTTSTTSQIEWSLFGSGVNFINATTGFNDGQKIVVLAEVHRSCAFAGGNIVFEVDAQSYCGQPLHSTGTIQAPLVTIDPATLDLIQLGTSVTDGNTIDVMYTVTTTATAHTNTIVITLPAGFTFTSNSTDTYTLDVPVGTVPGTYTLHLDITHFAAVCSGTYQDQVKLIRRGRLSCNPTCEYPGDQTSQTLDFTFESITVAVNDAPGCFVGSKVLTVVTTNTSGNETYQWFNGTTAITPGGDQSTYTATASGDYHVLVTNGACQATSNSITLYRSPTVYITTSGGASFLCASNPTSTLTAHASGGTGTLHYAWTGTGLNVTDQAVVQTSQPGTFSVTVSDDHCSMTTSASVVNEVTVVCPQPVCPGENPALTITNLSGVVGSYRAGWFPAGVSNPTLQTYLTEEGDYYAVAIADGAVAEACTLQTQVPCHITFKAHPDPFHVTPDNYVFACPTDVHTVSITNKDANDRNGNSNYYDDQITYAWSNGTTSLNDFTVTGWGSWFITAQDDVTGCVTKSNTVHITGPQVDISRHCGPNGTVLLTASTNFTAGTYHWWSVDAQTQVRTEITNPAVLSNSGATLTVSTPGVYVVTNDNSICTNTEDATYETMVTTAAPNADELTDTDGLFDNITSCNDPRLFTSDLGCIDRSYYDPLDPHYINPNSYGSHLPGNVMINHGTLSANDWNPGFWQGLGYGNSNTFMIVDGTSTLTDQVVWRMDVPVVAGNYYLFRGMVRNVSAFTSPYPEEIPSLFLRITYNIAGQSGYTYQETRQILYRNTNTQWVELSGFTPARAYVNNLGAVTAPVTATIEIVVGAGNVVGRDIAIDNISFIPVGLCDDLQTILNTTGRNCGSVASVDFYEKATCPGSSLTFNVIDLATDPNIQYNWTESGSTTILANTRNFTVIPTQTTSYTLTVNNTTLNCSFTQTVTAILLQPATGLSAGPDQTICAGTTVQLQASGASSYHWTPSAGLSNPNISNPLATPSQTTTYILTGSSPQGCSATDQVLITVKAKPTVNAGGDVSFCAGSAAQLNATGAVTYSWSPSAGLSNSTIPNPVASPVTTTTYTVTGTDSEGCSNSDEVQVTVELRPVVNAGPDVSICAGSSVTLNATGAVTYRWRPAGSLSNPTIPNPVASPKSTRTYIVTGYAANGCTNTDAIRVTVKPLPNVNAGADVSTCAGTPVTLNASGAATYTWSPSTGLSNPNIKNPVATPAMSMIYTVTGTSPNGCQKTDQVQVTVRALPTVNAGADVAFCAGSPVKLGASGAVTYVWTPSSGLSNPNISNPMANPIAQTLYTVTGTDVNGCMNTDQVLVTPRATPVVNAGLDRTMCGSSITLNGTSSLSGGTALWTGPNVATPSGMNTAVSPTTTSTYTFSYTVNYSGPTPLTCSASDQVVVNVIPRPKLTASGRRLNVSVGALPPGATVTGYTWYRKPFLGGGHTVYNPCANNPNCTSTSRGFLRYNWYVQVRYSYPGGTCTLTTGSVSAREDLETELATEEHEGLLAYPVPTENTLNLEYYSSNEMKEVQILDLLGKEVLAVAVSGYEAQIDVSSLPSGVYILRVTDTEGQVQIKRIEVRK